MRQTVSAPFEEWLKKNIAGEPPGTPLPTESRMARHWHLSRTTVASVLRRYKEKGLLAAVPGKGTFIRELPGRDEGRMATLNAAESLAGELRKMIVRGLFGTDVPLPSVKYLARKFHVAPATVTGAYRRLQQAGLVFRSGKRFWAGSLEQARDTMARPEMVIFLEKPLDQAGEGLFSHPGFRQAMLAMERILCRFGYRIRYAPHTGIDQEISRWMTARAYPHGVLFGDVSAEWYAKMRSRLRSLLSRAGAGSPRLVLLCALHFPVRLRRTMRINAGNMSTVLARTVARFIISHGYRTASLFFNERDPGYFFPAIHLKFHAELEYIHPGFELRFIVNPGGSFAGPREWYSNTHREQEQLASKYGAASRQSLIDQIRLAARDEWFVNPAGRTVWIFTSARDAADALCWAGEKGIGVPDPLSIMALENDPGYSHHNITSCEEDWSNVGHLMAHSLIGDIPIETSAKGYIRTRALIYERDTTVR